MDRPGCVRYGLAVVFGGRPWFGVGRGQCWWTECLGQAGTPWDGLCSISVPRFRKPACAHVTSCVEPTNTAVDLGGHPAGRECRSGPARTGRGQKHALSRCSYPCQGVETHRHGR